MEYERICKVETGVISPSKLRMKLMGHHHQRKKDASNSHSSRTSPSKIKDTDFVKDSLLTSDNENFVDAVTSHSLEILSLKPCTDLVEKDSQQISQNYCEQKERFAQQDGDSAYSKMHYFPKIENGNSSIFHPARATEDEDVGYDSNASSSSFEFHKRDRSFNNLAARSLSRPMSYKWNDAEKWIINTKNVPDSYSKNVLPNQTNRLPLAHMAKVAPESANYDNKLMPIRATETKRVDFCNKSLLNGVERFSFIPSEPLTSSTHTNGALPLVNLFPQNKNLVEVNHQDLPCIERSDDKTAVPGVRSVSMRDMGTEMTPVPSQEPSQTATPVGSTTPLRSPTSSIPSTPRMPTTPQTDLMKGSESQPQPETDKKQFSEDEIKLKTRREIAALGVQLGKMNIAAWASKTEQDKMKSASETTKSLELERIEFEKRAASWEEAEKSKHTARYKREQIQIQAWESQQKAKLEAELHRIKARVEQMRAQAQAKMVKNIALARQKSEEKRVAAKARRNEDAERIAAQAQCIRQTGRMPSSHLFCCGWL